MRPVPATVALLLMSAGSSAAGPVGPSAHRTVCELKLVERDRIDSRVCISCHDGSISPGVPYTLFSSGHSTGVIDGSSAGAHPIEVDYRQSFTNNNKFGLKPINKLNPILALSNGKMTCATCHHGRSLHPFRTAVTMEGSALCFSCHSGY